MAEQERRDGGWDLEPGEGYEPTFQVQEAQVAAPEASPAVGTFDPGAGEDYLTGLVKASIERGGRYGEYIIPVWWLEAVKADLEGRRSDAELIWGRSEHTGESSKDGEPTDGDPLYESLFSG